MIESNNILLIGLQNSGKSHYGAQFELRLSLGKGRLRKYVLEQDATLFQDVKERLVQGLPAMHTPTGTKKSKHLSLINDNSETIDLVWQDYAGEQIADIVDARKIPEKWLKDVAGSDSWLLFIRTDDIKVKKDPINQLPNHISFDHPDDSGEEIKFEYSDQTVFVELLQMMLFSKGAKQSGRIFHPSLTIVLTCWDEIEFPISQSEDEETHTPQKVLHHFAPMLHDFVCNTWDPKSLTFLGLSSLGMSLTDDQPNDEFVALGPENAGWVVLQDGSQLSDLTVPVAMCLHREA